MEDIVSVVIPYFNDSSTIDRALNSVKLQTHKVNEVIIIDDCSEDSDVLIDKVNSKYHDYDFEIVLKRNEINRNGAYSRNKGIEIASGKIIALLDADDYWKADHIELGIKNLGTSSFLYSNVIKEYLGKEKKIKVTDINQLNNKFDIILENPPQTSSFIFVKEQFEKYHIKFDEKLRRHQDYQFLISIIQSQVEMKYLDCYTACYSHSPRELSTRLNFNSMFSFWDNYKDIFSPEKLDRVIVPIFYSMILLENKGSIKDNINSFETTKYYSKIFPFNIYDRFDFSSGLQKKVFIFLYYLTHQRKDVIKVISKKILGR